jgi:hypothetical protein
MAPGQRNILLLLQEVYNAITLLLSHSGIVVAFAAEQTIITC